MGILFILIAYIALLWYLINAWNAGIFGIAVMSAGIALILFALFGTRVGTGRSILTAGFVIFSIGISNIFKIRERLDKEKSDKSPLEADNDSIL